MVSRYEGVAWTLQTDREDEREYIRISKELKEMRDVNILIIEGRAAEAGDDDHTPHRSQPGICAHTSRSDQAPLPQDAL